MVDSIELNFSTWPLIFLVSTSLGFFLSLVLILKRRSNPGNIFLSILILVFSISIADSVLYWSDYFLIKPQLLGVSLPFGLIFGPLFYLYVRKSIEQDKVLPKTSWLHFLPGLMYTIYLGDYFFTPVAEKLEAIQLWYNDSINTFFAPLFKILSLVIYTYLVHRLLKRADSKFEKIQWVKRANVIFILYTILFVSYHVLVVIGVFRIQWDYMISAAMVAFIYYIGYLGFASSELMGGLRIKNGKYRSTTLTPTASEAIFKKLKQHLLDNKSYLNPELRLTTLAEQLSISNHQLSQVINEKAEMNFAEFINSYRIEEAKQMLKVNDKVIDVAFAVGFNNKTSFYKSFKQFTGQAPNEFRRNLMPSK